MRVIKLLEYSQFLRHSYWDTFNKLPWDEFVKVRGASFGSLRNTFLHCVQMLDFYVNHLLQGNAELPGMNFDDYDSIDKIKTYLEQVESNVKRYLITVTPEELSRTLDRKYKDGTIVQMTVEDMMIDNFQEETHHRGEFIAILWQMGIEPPHMSWGRYINRQ
jgi:uncharacterized damage-inducible protein DinB